jgi:hypothetical protein
MTRGGAGVVSKTQTPADPFPSRRRKTLANKVGGPQAEKEIRTCPKCGERFEPSRIGRPRIYCPLCTPRKPEDVAASNERYWRDEAEKPDERNRQLREHLKQYRQTINRNRKKAGLPPLSPR